jgi:hypothetical protein
MPNRPHLALHLPKTAPTLLPYAKHVHACMAPSDWFKDLAALIAQLATGITTLDTAQTNVSMHIPGAVAVRDDAITALQDTVRACARGVESVGDAHPAQRAEIYQASGIPLAVAATPTPHTYCVDKGEHTCEAIVTMPVFEPGAMYFVQYTVDGTTWIDAAESKSSRVTLKNLPLHQTIHVRYRATGAAGRRLDWSQTLTYFVV